MAHLACLIGGRFAIAATCEVANVGCVEHIGLLPLEEPWPPILCTSSTSTCNEPLRWAIGPWWRSPPTTMPARSCVAPPSFEAMASMTSDQQLLPPRVDLAGQGRGRPGPADGPRRRRHHTRPRLLSVSAGAPPLRRRGSARPSASLPQGRVQPPADAVGRVHPYRRSRSTAGVRLASTGSWPTSPGSPSSSRSTSSRRCHAAATTASQSWAGITEARSRTGR